MPNGQQLNQALPAPTVGAISPGGATPTIVPDLPIPFQGVSTSPLGSWSDWSGLGLGLLGGLGSLFGGLAQQRGFGDIASQLQSGIGLQRQLLSQALAGLAPFQQLGGRGAAGELGMALQGVNAPQFINRILGQFQQSPAQHFAEQQALEAGRSELEARGLSGSGAAAQSLAQVASNIAGQQQQQYLSDVLSGRQQTLGALGQLGGMGLGAAQAGGQLGARFGENISELLAALGEAQAGQEEAGAQGWGGLLGGVLGGIGSIFL